MLLQYNPWHPACKIKLGHVKCINGIAVLSPLATNPENKTTAKSKHYACSSICYLAAIPQKYASSAVSV